MIPAAMKILKIVNLISYESKRSVGICSNNNTTTIKDNNISVKIFKDQSRL